jgi:hypothetical protein
LTMELCTTANGQKTVFDMEKELKHGKTVVSIQDTGREIRLLVKEDLYMLMEMLMKAIGIMIRLRAEALMSTLIMQSTLETGKKTDNTATELKLGLIMQNTKETTNTARSMESAHLNGQMAHLILVNFSTIISMEKVSIPGQITEFTKVNGEPTKCTEKELLHGLTVANM